MSKIKSLIAAAGLAAVLGSSCLETQTPEGKTVRFVTPPAAVSGPSENVGKDIVELLKDEFGQVTTNEGKYYQGFGINLGISHDYILLKDCKLYQKTKKK